LLGAAVVSAGSIAVYEHFREERGDWDDDRLPPTASAARGMTESVRSGSVLPLAQALDIAARHVPGEVVKVELEDEHGRSMYEIKVLADNGRVREIKFDARTGEVIEIEDD
jgi:uncharacterized membrane protein YkoI